MDKEFSHIEHGDGGGKQFLALRTQNADNREEMFHYPPRKASTALLNAEYVTFSLELAPSIAEELSKAAELIRAAVRGAQIKAQRAAEKQEQEKIRAEAEAKSLVANTAAREAHLTKYRAIYDVFYASTTSASQVLVNLESLHKVVRQESVSFRDLFVAQGVYSLAVTCKVRVGCLVVLMESMFQSDYKRAAGVAREILNLLENPSTPPPVTPPVTPAMCPTILNFPGTTPGHAFLNASAIDQLIYEVKQVLEGGDLGLGAKRFCTPPGSQLDYGRKYGVLSFDGGAVFCGPQSDLVTLDCYLRGLHSADSGRPNHRGWLEGFKSAAEYVRKHLSYSVPCAGPRLIVIQRMGPLSTPL